MPTLDRALAGLAFDAYHQPPTFSAAGDVHACVSSRPPMRASSRFAAPRSTRRDWLRDLDANFVFVFHPQLGRMHRGFLAGATAILPRIVLPSPPQPLVLTGHSLGGALALIVGALLLVNATPIAAIVTFGARRAGMSDFCGVLKDVRSGNISATAIRCRPSHCRPIATCASR